MLVYHGLERRNNDPMRIQEFPSPQVVDDYVMFSRKTTFIDGVVYFSYTVNLVK